MTDPINKVTVKQTVFFAQSPQLALPAFMNWPKPIPPMLRVYFNKHSELTVEGKGSQFILYRPKQSVKPQQLQILWEQGIELFELLKLGNKSLDSLLTALEDEEAQVRKQAARAVGLFHDIRILPILQKTLTDPDQQVRQGIAWTLGMIQDARVIETLLLALQDSSHQVCKEAENALQKVCHLVHVVVFGQDITVHDEEPGYTVWNPEVSELTISMPALRSIVLDTATYDFHQVERFLTYAVNNIGRQYLKSHVEVHLYGASDALHPNLRNNLTNMHKRVHQHQERIPENA